MGKLPATIAAAALSAALCLLAAGAGLAAFVWTRVETHVRRAASTEFLDPALNPTAPVPFIENDRDLGYRPVPGVHYLKRDPSGVVTEIATDTRGFRVDGPGRVGPAAAEILVVGCSQSWGQGVDNSATYAARLSRELGVSVANASVPGYSTVQSLLMAERHADLRPRLIVYGFYADHLFRNFERQSPRPSVARDADGWRIVPSEYRTHPALDRLADALVGLYGWFGVPREFSRGPVETEARNAYRAALRRLGAAEAEWSPAGRPTFDEWQTTLEAARVPLEAMTALANRLSARLVVVWIPFSDPPITPFPPELAAFLSERGAIVVDAHPLLSPYFGTPRLGEILVPNDWHLGERGHALVAQAITQALAAQPSSLRPR